jgi:hypothetical protein
MHEPGPSGQSLPATQAGQPYFAESEWLRFQADDRRAAATIVVLMGSIFTIGLFLYIGVCLSVLWHW